MHRTWGGGNEIASGWEFGGLTTKEYDANGNMTSIQRSGDLSPKTFQYDQNFNKVILETPIVGHPTSHTLNEKGDVVATNRGAMTLTYTHDNFGNVLSVSNGRTTYADQRNANGLLTHKFDLHNPQTLTYDQFNRLHTQTFASGRALTYSYNEYDHVTQISDTHGPTTNYVYDNMEKVLQKIVTPNPSGPAQVTTYTYDPRDRVVTTTDPMNRVTTNVYDPNEVREKPSAVIDPAGRYTYFVYDLRDRLIKKTDANGAVTKFTYDQRGNLTSITDANGQITSYDYDLNDRKIRETRPSVAGVLPVNRVQEFFYDGADRMVREIMRSASTDLISKQDRAISYQYDLHDRMVKKIIQREAPHNTQLEDDSQFEYENQLDKVLITRARNGVANLTFANEAAPPFLGTGFSVGASQAGNPLELITGNFTITRDVTGEIAEIKRDGATIYTKTYDPAGRLRTASAGSFSTELVYDGYGRKATVSHSTGESGVFQYDLLNRITSINWTGGSLGANPISEVLTYHPQTGNITSLQRENGTYTIGYDEVDQATSSSTTGSLNYNRNWTYDFLGNRLQDSANGPGNFVSNFLTSNGVSSFLADPNGFGETIRETTGSSVKHFAFRADGRMNAVQNGTTSAAYYFDALGRRTAKDITTSQGNFKQSYVHLEQEDRILLGKAGDGTVHKFLDGKGVDEHLAKVSSGGNTGYVVDHLGSVLNGEPAGPSHSFGLFGEQAAASMPMMTPASSPALYGFTGREFDAESGLSYHRARMYNFATGKWLSQDPIGKEGDDANYYRYVANRSLLTIDPNGMFGASVSLSAGYRYWALPSAEVRPIGLAFTVDKDFHVQAGFVSGGSARFGAGFEVSGGASISIAPNAQKLDDLGGRSFGGSASYGPYSLGYSRGNGFSSFSTGVGPGLGIGASFDVGYDVASKPFLDTRKGGFLRSDGTYGNIEVPENAHRYVDPF